MQIPWRSTHPPVRRAAPDSWLPSATACLLAAQVSVFVLQWGVREAVGPAHPDPLLAAGGISAAGLRAWRLWEPLTALFVVGAGAGWLLPWNWLLLALTGRPLETVIGRAASGAGFLCVRRGGGLAQAVVQWAGHGPNVAVGEALAANRGRVFRAGVRASAVGVVAGISAHAAAQDRTRSRRGGGSLVRRGGGRRADAGHGVGWARGRAGRGCLSMRGLGFGRRAQENDPLADVAEVSVETVPAAVAAADGNLIVPRFTERERRMTPREYVSEKIDPILEKISRHGIGSLTAEERRVLDKGREKIVRGTLTEAAWRDENRWRTGFTFLSS